MNVEYIDPYKIAKFTVTKYSLEPDSSFLQTTITYEIPPGEMDPTTGWVDFTADSFDDPDIKEAIAIAVNEWTPEVRAAHKAHVMETYVPSPTDVNTALSYDQIDTLLDDIIATDGTSS
jgi:hypothetical protein